MNFFRKKEPEVEFDYEKATEVLATALSQSLPQEAQKPTIEKAFDTTLNLLEKMRQRELRLTSQLEDITEELRQTRVVIDGANAMMGCITEGMGKGDEKHENIRAALENSGSAQPAE